ncbi:hypothetical protein NQ315_003664 [Exocentrus adspersus]|uniref:Uncharacterized protein n=1 Tax=Exocentrus adspersus TaxID=1586481 RepID=A0AAV8VAC3_9CUCU|nr:hypothetical protein NQ315_003664 [Exocentrus adspersus]
MGKASSSAIMLASTTLSSSILSESETERYCIDTTPSSSTVTASEARELFPTVNTSSSTSEEIKTEIRTRKRRYPMHFGECKSSDMDNPKQAKINWQIAKKKIHIQDRKIRSLQQSNRRLKSRIYNLNSLLTLLKQKYSLTETAGSLITFCTTYLAKCVIIKFCDPAILTFLRGSVCNIAIFGDFAFAIAAV